MYLLNITYPGRREKKDFVARIDKHLEGLVEERLCSRRDKDFIRGVFKSETPLVVVADLLAEFKYS